MSIVLTIEVDNASQIDAAIQTVVQSVCDSISTADYSPAFERIATEYEKFHQKLFENETAPDGTGWAPLAASTIKAKGHDVILHETGRLGTSLFSRTADSIRDIDPTFLTFGEDVPYSAFLDVGTRRMPARPHVGLNEDMVDKTAEIIAESTVVVAGGAP